MGAAPPEDFRCPISLELMSDPVILATGQTYDRTSIQRWLDAGHRTCPKTKQLLYDDIKLIPNYALRSLVHQWAASHGIDLKKKPVVAENHATSSPHGSCFFVPSEREGGLKARVETLVKSLSHAGVQAQAQARMDAVKKLIGLAKE